MRVAILYNEPTLPADHPDYASEAGVLESVRAFNAVTVELGWNCNLIGVRASLAELWSNLRGLRSDVVVNLCEGFAGRSRHEPHVAALLELMAVPYTGSPPECLALVHDKASTKQLFIGADIATAEFFRVRVGEPLPLKKMEAALARGPLFVKPAAEDASLGVSEESVVSDMDALQRQIAKLRKQYGEALIESYLPGREFNVSVVSLPELQMLPLAEIEFQRDSAHPWPIVTYESKWAVGSAADQATPVRCPAIVEPDLANSIRELAIRAFQATGCRDYARIDLRLDGNGEPCVLEVNANPDLAPDAGFLRTVRAFGWTYAEFARRLITTAAQRSKTVQRTTMVATTGPRLAPTIRALQAPDKPPLLAALRATDMFRPDEIEVADEVLTEALRDGPAGHYQVRVAEIDGRPVGWSAYGLVPLTDATYDLYWIAVQTEFQRHGVGRALLADCEAQLRLVQARWLLAETSSLPIYDQTRAFYLRTGFELVGEVPDFYRTGDGRVTYGKRICP